MQSASFTHEDHSSSSQGAKTISYKLDSEWVSLEWVTFECRHAFSSENVCYTFILCRFNQLLMMSPSEFRTHLLSISVFWASGFIDNLRYRQCRILSLPKIIIAVYSNCFQNFICISTHTYSILLDLIMWLQPTIRSCF